MIKLKKKTVATGSYNWRPNFRDFESLPDIRAVRTQVFIPAIFITAALLFGGLIIYREYKAMGVNESIAALRAEIAESSESHDAKVKLNAEFMASMGNLEEIVTFKSDKLVASDFLLAVSSRLLESMYLNRIEYGESIAVIEGNVQVPAAEASQIVNAFLESIEKDDILQGLLTEYKLTSLQRDEASNVIKFRIEITAEEEKKK